MFVRVIFGYFNSDILSRVTARQAVDRRNIDTREQLAISLSVCKHGANGMGTGKIFMHFHRLCGRH